MPPVQCCSPHRGPARHLAPHAALAMSQTDLVPGPDPWAGGAVSDPVFQEAYRRVRSRFSDRQWQTLTSQQITEEIYREMAVIDAEKRRRSGDETPEPEQG
jgi:hypothetical protein